METSRHLWSDFCQNNFKAQSTNWNHTTNYFYWSTWHQLYPFHTVCCLIKPKAAYRNDVSVPPASSQNVEYLWHMWTFFLPFLSFQYFFLSFNYAFQSLVGFFLTAEKSFLLKWHFSKLLGNSLALHNGAKEVMTIDGFYFRLEDSAEVLNLYGRHHAGEYGLEWFYFGKFNTLVEGAVTVFVHLNSWTVWSGCLTNGPKI